jgi:deazaflavin-dependent oxidoreductase (nitroreductase family)
MSGMNDYNQSIIDEFRANKGAVGGPFEGAPMVLLHHKGRKTGTERINPLVYMDDGDRILIFASKGGSSKHPEWYLNLMSNPDATVEVGTEKYAVKAEEVVGEERDRLYAKNAAERPAFGQYQERTTRVIPVIALTRV